MILLDSNIWIYLLDKDTPENDVVDRRLSGVLREESVVLPTLVQAEVLHYIVRQLRTGADSVVHSFLAFPGEVEALTAGVVQAGARILLDHAREGIGGRDAMLLATARMTHARLVTHDRALGRLAKRLGIAIWDPVKGAPPRD